MFGGLKVKKDNNTIFFVIVSLAIIARIIVFIFASPKVCQHDVVTASAGGHMDYAFYIFNNFRLADTNFYEFAQPPLNAVLQALFMKFVSLFYDYGGDRMALYTTCKVLSLAYSFITLYLLYKIIAEFDLGKKLGNIFFAIMSLYPGIIITTSQYSNDALGYLFFYLSLYLSMRWAKTKKLSTIILLAFSIGFGMITKISVGLIAFITGPMMVVILIRSLFCKCKAEEMREKSFKYILFELLIFSIIVFPLGLSYSIRNYYLFGQKFGEIYDVAKGTFLDTSSFNVSFAGRYLTIAFDKLYDGKYDIFHDWREYNIWVDLIKTSAFDEFQLRIDALYPFFNLIWFLNIVFYFVTFLATLYNIISFIVALVTKRINMMSSNILNLRIISVMLYSLAVFAFVSFNLMYPNYSCNSNYRYVQYITLALTGSLIVALNDLVFNGHDGYRTILKNLDGNRT